jgi:hypothetical protein
MDAGELEIALAPAGVFAPDQVAARGVMLFPIAEEGAVAAGFAGRAGANPMRLARIGRAHLRRELGRIAER